VLKASAGPRRGHRAAEEQQLLGPLQRRGLPRPVQHVQRQLRPQQRRLVAQPLELHVFGQKGVMLSLAKPVFHTECDGH
jgi:hypothetical protein